MSTPLEIPYTYDNRLKGRIYAVGSTLGMAFAFTYFSKIDLDQPGPVLFITAICLVIGLWVYRAQAGARCEITATHVTFEPDRFLGIPSASAKGTFVASDFAHVERDTISINHMARVTLVPARKELHKIHLIPLRPSQANYLGELIATAMKLPLKGDADRLLNK